MLASESRELIDHAKKTDKEEVPCLGFRNARHSWFSDGLRLASSAPEAAFTFGDGGDDWGVLFQCCTAG